MYKRRRSFFNQSLQRCIFTTKISKFCFKLVITVHIFMKL